MGNLVSIRTIGVDVDLTTAEPAASLRLLYKIEPFLALLIAIALAPVMITLAAVILILSRRSPLVRHRRVGWRGEELGVLKFRTMWPNGPRSGPFFAIENLPEVDCFLKTEHDERVASRFATWCRRHSLDEIPQLAHIVCGKMSFVGPRPITRAELEAFYASCATEVLSLRPGLTGLWQVMGRNRLTYRQRRRLDLWLVRRASPRLFLALAIRTIPQLFRGTGAY